jgi:MbtH protein
VCSDHFGESTLTNPFEDKDGVFLVLKNNEGQHSIWPQFAAIPAGWTSVFGPESRQACVDFVEQHWIDMRPASLIAAMEGSARDEQTAAIAQ